MGTPPLPASASSTGVLPSLPPPGPLRGWAGAPGHPSSLRGVGSSAPGCSWGGGRTPRRDTRRRQFWGAAGHRALASSRVPRGCCGDELPSLRGASGPEGWEGPEGRTPFGIHLPLRLRAALKDPLLPGSSLPERRGHEMAPPPGDRLSWDPPPLTSSPETPSLAVSTPTPPRLSSGLSVFSLHQRPGSSARAAAGPRRPPVSVLCARSALSLLCRALWAATSDTPDILTPI